MVFPPLAQDAHKALKSDGKNPLAKKMVTAQDYFNDRAASSLSNTAL
jgi:hypothetical protein